MGDNINSKDFIIGTLVGGIVGATVALMFAPKSGRELRADINEGAMQVVDRANEWKDTAQEKGSEFKDMAYERGSELTKKAIDKTTQLTRDVVKKTDDMTKGVQEKLHEQDEALEAIQESAQEDQE